ncbi:aminophospholipid-translocating ATPase [Histoplasma capsulatum G186AR]|nr:aminophospholipid-translocating ATPase [Histoplasma capsulatum]QSS75189.1 aminophospholipid-translocating ATPase [Histoplasma capsulatum G186AR]
MQELLDRRTSQGQGKDKGGDGAHVQTEEVESGNSQPVANGAAAAGESADVPSCSRRSLDVHELLSKGFGAIRKGHL